MMCMVSVPALLYLASILVGLAHGAHWTLMVATSSELFGLKHFGALYNTLSISATVGSYLLSVKLAGYIYDRQLATIQAAALATGKILTGPQKCIGPQCFRSAGLCLA
jgi:MFS family permease